MRAFLLPFLFALLLALPAKVLAADPNDDVRKFVNGTWQLVFREPVAEGGTSGIKSVATIITITLRYDGTRTIVQDSQFDDQPPVRMPGESNDFYRVDDIDGTNFTMTTWSEGEAPKSSARKRTGADAMMAEGSDAVYQRVAGSAEALADPLPPQRDAPAQASQESRDADARAYMVGRWTAAMIQGSLTINSIIDYTADMTFSGTQTMSAGDLKQTYNVSGTYSVASTGAETFTLTLNVPSMPPITSSLQIIDQNTLFNAADNYRAVRAPP